jgi:hypothetical protein
MPTIETLFTFHSGRLTRKLFLQFKLVDRIGVPDLQNAIDVFIKGKFETLPTYGSGTLSISEKDSSPFSIKVKASQPVLDYLTSCSEDTDTLSTSITLDSAKNSVTIEVNIGLTDPEPSNEISTLTFCQNCSSQSLNLSTDLEPRSTVSDLMYMLMFHHIYNRDAKNWSKLPTTEIFTLWKQKLVTLKITSPASAEPWRYIDSGYTADRYGLCYGLAILHSTQEQEIIKSGKLHDCQTLSDCPLNHLFNDQVSVEDFYQDFCDYLEILFSEYFLTTYFADDRSRLGLAILSTMWPNSKTVWFNHPIRAITDGNDQIPAAQWILRPTPLIKK